MVTAAPGAPVAAAVVHRPDVDDALLVLAVTDPVLPDRVGEEFENRVGKAVDHGPFFVQADGLDVVARLGNGQEPVLAGLGIVTEDLAARPFGALFDAVKAAGGPVEDAPGIDLQGAVKLYVEGFAEAGLPVPEVLEGAAGRVEFPEQIISEVGQTAVQFFALRAPDQRGEGVIFTPVGLVRPGVGRSSRFGTVFGDRVAPDFLEHFTSLPETVENCR
ncbi:MAG: hypothetical protein BWY73_01353 [candidate division TA06 bacterium ADurb.Bin417]|uniref:Uncharacterized protein n=1 Tax=candidate division TA06 bacterium ADurb.Bin417 TaxID=1852828 RepID=A0A1V5MAM9_UNCT6|nr:MAG: hypothetical protein BWY73_01353 [candidate division TA06 bacterium ADurb.Bin417]